MKITSLKIAVKIAALILLAGLPAEAAEVKLLSATAMRSVVHELGPRFERNTGHKLVTKFMPGTVVKREIDAGETFDLAIAVTPAIVALIKEGKIDAGTRADVAYSGVGVGVRAGAPKPDISSVDAFRRALLNAKSVAHSAEGASGAHFRGMLERLGIGAEMKPKLRPVAGAALAQALQSGEAEMAVIIASIILDSGAQLVGPVPRELQFYIGLAAGVGVQATVPDAAKALLKVLTEPAAAAVLKAKGMEPGAPP